MPKHGRLHRVTRKTWIACALLALALVAWPLSYFVSLPLCVDALSIGVRKGFLFVALTSPPATTADGATWIAKGGNPMSFPPQFYWRPSRVSCSTGMGQPPSVRWYFLDIVYVPLWWLVIAAACFVVPLWLIDRRRPLPGHCQKCNYNLTGNTSGRCPECGTATPM